MGAIDPLAVSKRSRKGVVVGLGTWKHRLLVVQRKYRSSEQMIPPPPPRPTRLIGQSFCCSGKRQVARQAKDHPKAAYGLAHVPGVPRSESQSGWKPKHTFIQL